jgi:hypothetical protein
VFQFYLSCLERTHKSNNCVTHFVHNKLVIVTTDVATECPAVNNEEDNLPLRVW